MIFNHLFKMKTITIIILLFVLPIAAYCQQGFKQDLNHIASITFPDMPKTTVEKNETVFALNDSGIVYLAIAAPVQKGIKDYFTKNSNDSLFQGVIKGSLQSSKGILFYRKNVVMNGLKGLEFGYKAVLDSVKSYRYHQAFYVNNTLIFYGYWSKDSLQADDKGMRSFFNSFKLKVKPVDITQSDVSDLSFKAGEVIGYLICIGAVVLLVIFLVKKFT